MGFRASVILSGHAQLQMAVRDIDVHLVMETIREPEQRVAASQGRWVYQARYFDADEHKEMLMRVIAEPRSQDQLVVSVYKTSRIMKYWLEEPPA